MKALLLVMVGGGMGAGLRYGVGLAASRLFGLGFPWGTLLCNVIGSLAMGLLIGGMAQGLLGDGRQAENARLLLGVGLLGGFTTFSTFSLDAIAVWQRGEVIQAGAYVAASIIIAFTGFLLGMKLMRGFA
ncbi:MAG: fluoride efflux transporter CrcB [Alphaproteobacteria bacterium]